MTLVPPTRAHAGWRAPAAVLLASGLVLTAVVTAPTSADAAVSEDAPVIISEIYGAGGNSGAVYNQDYVELYNASDATVDVSTWSLQYTSASGSSYDNQTVALTGTIEPGEFYLIGMSGGSNGDAIPTADATGSFNMSATNGKVALVDSTTALTVATGAPDESSVVDFVGYGSANDFAGEAAAPSPSSTQSISRVDLTNTADNSVDFTQTDPSPAAAEPDDSEEPEEPGEVLTIAEVQGTGEQTEYYGDKVTVQGVVTAVYATAGLNGYYIQTAGTGGTVDFSTHDASDGIFVYSSATMAEVAIGDVVEVTGTAGEYAGVTQISVPSGGLTLLDEEGTVEPFDLDWETLTEAQRESVEGMLVDPVGAYTITDTYSTNQYGEVGLATGDSPLIQPTDVARPGSTEYDDVVADNLARGIVLDDGSSANFLNNGDLVPSYLQVDNPVRVGGTVTFTDSVIVTEGGSPSSPTWRYQPTTPQNQDGSAPHTVTLTSERPAAPESVGGDISIATFNVLNYFTTLGESRSDCDSYDDRDGNPITVDGCSGDNGPRGAWSEASYQRQLDKIVSAISQTDASIVGLMEIENSVALGDDVDEAVATLVDALNSEAGSEVWAYVPSSADLPDVSEQDVITNAIIYQQDLVTPSGDSVALGTESGSGGAFENAREPIGQVFVPVDSTQEFLVVVNHFKSKGSGTGENADQGDGQGASNPDRIEQATALAEWVSELGGDDMPVALVGDFNSYTMEDPLQVLYDDGYVDAVSSLGVEKSTYNYDGMNGSLDHVLLNSVAAGLATGADVWNINAAETIVWEYSRYNYHAELFYAADAYRSSDHDPVIVGFEVPTYESETAIAVDDAAVEEGDDVTGTVAVASEVDATGSVEILVDGEVVDTVELEDGIATFTISGLEPGDYTISAVYLGSGDVQASESEGVSVTVAEETTEPTDPPTEPTDPPTEPTDPPTEPTDPPTEPTDPPTEPTDPPTEPTDPPTEPTDPPTEPTDPPTEPTDPPTEPTDPPSADASIWLSKTTVPAGDTVDVKGTGFEAGESVRVELHSDPVLLTTTVADEAGEIAVTVTIPASTDAGTHDVVLEGVTSGLDLSAALEVTVEAGASDDEGLPATGGQLPTALMLWGMILIAAGVVLVAAQRRRQRA